MSDSTNLLRIVQKVQPSEIYNLAAQNHVAVSFPSTWRTRTALARCGCSRRFA
jgi:GDPmannose 4,6-dehydratase